jgi:S-adenosylmethionine decarboxylase
MGEYEFWGDHLLGELYGICPEKLNDAELLEKVLIRGIIKSGATICTIQAKKFCPSGVTILIMLAESHVSVHTYPDAQALFFDAFICGRRCKPYCIVETLLVELNPRSHQFQHIVRGNSQIAAAAPERKDFRV